MQVTLGFMQVGHDQQTSANSKFKLWFWLANNFEFLFLNSTLYFQSAAVGLGGRNTNSQPA
jgi:hypothetical protein